LAVSLPDVAHADHTLPIADGVQHGILSVYACSGLIPVNFGADIINKKYYKVILKDIPKESRRRSATPPCRTMRAQK
jgi:hypothetical protein